VRTLLSFLMALNALVFFFGAVLHAGVVIGPFHQPQIFPATVVEILCGLSLAWGATALSNERRSAWRVALMANLVALAGVLLGVIALIRRQQIRLAAIALDHRIMLTLIGVSLLILLFTRPGISTVRTTDHRRQTT
jgi:hypothetical protein